MNRFLCAAVLGALAVETIGATMGHHHGHHHHAKYAPFHPQTPSKKAQSLTKHHRKDLSDVDWNNPDLYKNVDWDAVFGKEGAAATPATAAAPAVAPEAASSAKSSSSSSSDDDSSSVSNDRTGFGGITSAIANGNVDEYIGNVGAPYGSNIIKVSDAKADSFQYTNNFKNTGSSPVNVIVWNKSGPDGQANSGQFSAPALSFELAPGASQYVAFDKNSQVAFCNFSGKKTSYGANDCTFGEADFGNESNGGWSGYDVSSIQNTAGNDEALSISSTDGATSSNTGNNYVSDKQAGGIGGNLAPGNVRLTTVFG